MSSVQRIQKLVIDEQWHESMPNWNETETYYGEGHLEELNSLLYWNGNVCRLPDTEKNRRHITISVELADMLWTSGLSSAEHGGCSESAKQSIISLTIRRSYWIGLLFGYQQQQTLHHLVSRQRCKSHVEEKSVKNRCRNPSKWIWQKSERWNQNKNMGN